MCSHYDICSLVSEQQAIFKQPTLCLYLWTEPRTTVVVEHAVQQERRVQLLWAVYQNSKRLGREEQKSTVQ